MPIAQSRIISLIAAAEDYQQALLSLREQAFALAQNLRDGAIDPEEALKGLLVELQECTRRLKFPSETVATIADEKAHFRSNEGRNRGAAKRAERKRREKGLKIMPPTRQGLLIVPAPRTGASKLVAGNLLDTRSLDAEAEAAALEEERSDNGEGDSLLGVEEGQVPDGD